MYNTVCIQIFRDFSFKTLSYCIVAFFLIILLFSSFFFINALVPEIKHIFTFGFLTIFFLFNPLSTFSEFLNMKIYIYVDCLFFFYVLLKFIKFKLTHIFCIWFKFIYIYNLEYYTQENYIYTLYVYSVLEFKHRHVFINI